MKILKRIYLASLILITLIAIGILFYPSFSNYINNKYAVSTISEYNESMNNIGDPEIEELKKESQKYNEELFLKGTEPEGHKEESMIGYIEIPSINIYLPIYYGTSNEVLRKGVGVLEKTSIPVGGKSTHSVLSAHTGVPTQKLFTDIDQLKSGDFFYIHVLKEKLTYKVDNSKVVKPNDSKDLKIYEGKDYVTLLTCYPYGANTDRLLVRGERVEEGITIEEDLNKPNKENNGFDEIRNNNLDNKDSFNKSSMFIIVILILVIIIIFIQIIRNQRKKK